MDFSVKDKGVVGFGPFQLDASRRRLTRGGEVIKLPAKQLDTLLYFVENPNRVIEKDELLAAVWPGRIVEESSLTQTVFLLRRALQADETERYIITAPGRGYRFVADMVRLPEVSPGGMESAGSMPPAGTVLISRAAVSTARHPLWAPIAGMIGLLIMLCVMALALHRDPAPPGEAAFNPPPHSVAVLAFTNMSGDPKQEYFSDGISEELISALSRVDALRVAARTSAFSFKGKSASIADIARQLNVGAVLEGSVRREGPRVRITADLVNAATGFELWSRSFDRNQGDMLEVQREIAEAASDSLQVTLLGADVAKLTLGGTSKPESLDAYLRGMALRGKTQETVDQVSGAEEAVAEFDKAISIDPSYASARAARANVLIAIAVGGVELSRARKNLIDARLEAERAIALAPDLASAHVARGYALRNSLDLVGADKEITLARDLAPGDASIELSYAEMQLTDGHVAAAVKAAELAAELDPLTPITYYTLASRLLYAGRYEDTLIALRHGRALDNVGNPSAEGFALYSLGRYEAARQACTAVRDWSASLCLALVYHRLGRQEDAAAELAKVKAVAGDEAAFQYADVYSQWGEKEAAVKWLEVAYGVQSPGLTYLKVDPFLDPIRSTPGYKDIERRLNFPP